jgi:predicted dehydrogenase
MLSSFKVKISRRGIMKQVTAVLLGAGSRAVCAYAPYALSHPDEIKFVGVADPIIERVKMFRESHNIPEEQCFDDWKTLLEQPKMADAVVICTQDRMHFEPTIMALEKGYHVMLEKPMSPNARECLIMGEYAKKYDRIFTICHVLRYTKFFRALKELLNNKVIGKLVSIQHNENVGYWHQAHSFVRGNWRNSKETSPMILAKCCHDMDIMLWLADADCSRISSFGSLLHLRKENAPEGAPKVCQEGCPAENKCGYYAPKYFGEHNGWLDMMIDPGLGMEDKLKQLKKSPYGRCVYQCDNDVVDHQVVNIEFSSGTTAAFTMCGFTKDINRTIKLMGTEGEIRGDMNKNEIEVCNFNTGRKDIIRLDESSEGHGGGDYGIMHDFVRLLQNGNASECVTPADISVQSHLMAFAAEKSRLEGKVISMDEFTRELNM